jgi:DNA-binding response OmpR family regulator
LETLIVQETDQDILEIVCIALEFEGFQVCSVLGYDTDFILLIKQVRPHVVMLDYRLDGSECILICRKIKANFPHLPVIASSCNNNIHSLYQEHGFDDYLCKPFDIDLLYRVFRKYIPKPDASAIISAILNAK